jgi:hypothetical protein
MKSKIRRSQFRIITLLKLAFWAKITQNAFSGRKISTFLCDFGCRLLFYFCENTRFRSRIRLYLWPMMM